MSEKKIIKKPFNQMIERSFFIVLAKAIDY